MGCGISKESVADISFFSKKRLSLPASSHNHLAVSASSPVSASASASSTSNIETSPAAPTLHRIAVDFPSHPVKPYSPLEAWTSSGVTTPLTATEILSSKCAPPFKVEKDYPENICMAFDDAGELLTTANNSVNVSEPVTDTLEADLTEESILKKRRRNSYDSDQLARAMAGASLSSSPASYMRELLEHFDRSTEPLHLPTTPRAWRSTLLGDDDIETLDFDIQNILLDHQLEVTSLSKQVTSLRKEVASLNEHEKIMSEHEKTMSSDGIDV